MAEHGKSRKAGRGVRKGGTYSTAQRKAARHGCGQPTWHTKDAKQTAASLAHSGPVPAGRITIRQQVPQLGVATAAMPLLWRPGAD